MSTQVSPELVTEFSTNAELIPSLSIDHILVQREHAINIFEQGLKLIAEARELMMEASKGKMYGYTDIVEKAVRSGKHDKTGVKNITRLLDAEIWTRLMDASGMKTFMSNKQIEQWRDSLNTDVMPEVTLDNVLASFQALHENKNETFEEGVIDLFKQLSWNYKTNCPCKLGKKIIINNMVGNRSYVTWTPSDSGRNKLNDLEKMFCLLDKKNVPDHRTGAGEQFYQFTQTNQWNGEKFEHEYFSVKYFQVGTGHLQFKRPDLVEKLNTIISRHFENALPARV